MAINDRQRKFRYNQRLEDLPQFKLYSDRTNPGDGVYKYDGGYDAKPHFVTDEQLKGIRTKGVAVKNRPDNQLASIVSSVTSSGAASQPVPELEGSNTTPTSVNTLNPTKPSSSAGISPYNPTNPSFNPSFMGLNSNFLSSLLGLSGLLSTLFGYRGGFGGGNPPANSTQEIDETATGGFDDILGDINGAIDKYVEDLRGEANGDYDFALKWITREHEKAMGTDDKARAEFMELVADKLEERIGRIPYDYFKKTNREKQDLMDFLIQQNREEEDLIARRKEFATQQSFEVEQEQDQTNQSFNARGLLGSGIQKGVEQQQDTRRQIYEVDPFNRQADLESERRAFETKRGILGSQRRLEDITTEGRRGGIDANDQFQFGSENEKRKLEKRLAEITREEQRARDAAKLQSQAYAFNSY